VIGIEEDRFNEGEWCGCFLEEEEGERSKFEEFEGFFKESEDCCNM
jgi:hypothetical protein